MKILITPQEAVALAFADGEYLPPETLTEEQIKAAEERYIRPVTGRALYERLLDGAYAELRTEFAAPVLALGVRYMVQPALRLRLGACGAAMPDGAAWRAASDTAAAAAGRSLKRQISLLVRRLSDELERRKEEYPEYEPRENVLNRCRIYGDLVQIL